MPSVSVGGAMAPSADSRALIEALLVIVGPDGDRRSLERDVLMACGFIRRAKSIKEAQENGRYGIVTNAQKKAAKGFARTLHKLAIIRGSRSFVDMALKDDEGWTREDAEGFPLTANELKKWAAQYTAASECPLTSKEFRAVNHAKYEAARWAARLLEKHGIALTLSRRGEFRTLAAVLYGEPRADFTHICRMCLRERAW
jgi:hypothetical protein